MYTNPSAGTAMRSFLPQDEIGQSFEKLNEIKMPHTQGEVEPNESLEATTHNASYKFVYILTKCPNL